MFTVGLTGMSGAGKSYVSAYLCDNGFYIINADEIYHELVSCESACIRELESVFGSAIINTDRSLNRAELAKIVFSDRKKLGILNTVTHKYVLNEMRLRIAGNSGICIADVPQLFESGFDSECDITVAVVAERDVCLSRIIERDGLTREQAEKRLNNQHDAEFFKSHCDIIIENNGKDISSDIENTIKLIKEKSYV